MFPISRWRVFILHATLCAVVLAFLSIGSVISLPSAVQQNVSSDSILVTEVPIATSTSPTVANITSSSDEISVEMSTEIVSSTTTQSYDTVTIKCKSPSEVYSNCSNSCPASCEDPTRKPCRTFCWNGCECAPGYVKNHRWQCIPIDECPKCGANEHFRNCGANCEPSCDTYENVPVYCSNRASCKRGCFCNYGFVRDLNKNGTCVSISQCPQKCGANEYWDVNGEPCIRTALNPRPRCLFEAAKPACICNTGFRRNVNTKQCETLSPIADKLDIKCSGNETYSHCNSECARNCFDDQKRQMCQTICNRGCFCKEGYLRENSGRCVLPQDCQQWNSYSTPVWRV